VVSVLSNSAWLPRSLKNVRNEITKLFSVDNTTINISTNQDYNLVYEVLQNYPNTNEFCSWNQWK